MPVEFSVLASGSEGNAFYLSTGKTQILIDCGITYGRIEKLLARIGKRASQLNAILVTHEHGDHAGELATVYGKLRIPIVLTEGTGEAIDEKIRHRAPEYIVIQPGQFFSINDLEAFAFPVSHNANAPVGFTFAARGIRIGFATDLGAIEGTVAVKSFPACDLVYLESNHDVEVIEQGAHDFSRRDRIKACHLSNAKVCEFIRTRLSNRTSRLILGHISRDNNHPDLVKSVATRALNGRDTELIVAGPAEATGMFSYSV